MYMSWIWLLYVDELSGEYTNAASPITSVSFGRFLLRGGVEMVDVDAHVLRIELEKGGSKTRTEVNSHL